MLSMEASAGEQKSSRSAIFHGCAKANGSVRFGGGMQKSQQGVKKFSSVFVALPGRLAPALLWRSED
jgi:hypothetical protein